MRQTDGVSHLRQRGQPGALRKISKGLAVRNVSLYSFRVQKSGPLWWKVVKNMAWITLAKLLNTPCLSVLTYKMGMLVVCTYLMRLWRFCDLIGLNNFE